MAYQQGVLPMPTGVAFTESSELNNEYAERLENLEASFDGLRLRGGLDELPGMAAAVGAGEYIHYIVGYQEPRGMLVVLTKSRSEETGRVIVYDPASRTVVSNQPDAMAYDTPVSTLEATTGAANSPLLFFYEGHPPRKLTVGTWALTDAGITFKNSGYPPDVDVPESEYNDPSGGVVYKSRLYLFKRGVNTIYYLPPGVVQGEAVKLQVGNIFGAAGVIVRVVVVGFSAGAGVQSWLAVLFDTGDILTMSGVDPDSATDWRVETKVSLHSRIYPAYTQYGASAYIMTDLGILDLAQVIASNGVASDAIIGLEVDEYLRTERDKVEMVQFGERVLFAHSERNEHLVYNTRWRGWCTYTGFYGGVRTQYDTEESVVYVYYLTAGVVGDKVYFATVDGETVVEGFDATTDRGSPIVGKLDTRWLDFGTRNAKKFVYAYISMGYVANGTLGLNYDVDYRRGTGLTEVRFNNLPVRWGRFSGRTGHLWADVRTLLWSGVVNLATPPIKLHRMCLARDVSMRIVVRGDEVERLVINKITCEYIEQGR